MQDAREMQGIHKRSDTMIADDEIARQAARILRELPQHPAARRFCFAGWDRRDYLRLEAQICLSGTPTLRRVLPDESILVGPPTPPAQLQHR
jgi:hypothetical protein